MWGLGGGGMVGGGSFPFRDEGHTLYTVRSSRAKSLHGRGAEFLYVIGTKVLRVFLLATVTSTNLFNPPPHLENKWLETGL